MYHLYSLNLILISHRRRLFIGSHDASNTNKYRVSTGRTKEDLVKKQRVR